MGRGRCWKLLMMANLDGRPSQVHRSISLQYSWPLRAWRFVIGAQLYSSNASTSTGRLPGKL